MATTAAPSDALVLFGASGDLAHKMIFTALYALCRHGRLNVPIIGVAKSGWSLDDFKMHAADAAQKAGDSNAEVVGRLADLMRYIDGDYRNADGESVSRISEIRRSQRKSDAELRAAPLPSTDAPEPRKTTVKHFHSSTQRGRHKILVIDVGGTHVKMSRSSGTERREFNSGSDLTAADMVRQVLDLTKDWEYDVVSIGYPGPVVHNRPLAEPHNLGKGWVGFDFDAHSRGL